MRLGMQRGNRRRTKHAVLRIIAVLCLGMLMMLHTGCYYYRVGGKDAAPATEPKSEILWSTVWGFKQQNINTDEKCLGNPMAQVRASTNFGYALLTVISLGFVAPIELEWKCAKDQPGGGRGNVGDSF